MPLGSNILLSMVRKEGCTKAKMPKTAYPPKQRHLEIFDPVSDVFESFPVPYCVDDLSGQLYTAATNDRGTFLVVSNDTSVTFHWPTKTWSVPCAIEFASAEASRWVRYGAAVTSTGLLVMSAGGIPDQGGRSRDAFFYSCGVARQLPGMHKARRFAAAGILRDASDRLVGIMVGGDEQGTAECFDMMSQQWYMLPACPALEYSSNKTAALVSTEWKNLLVVSLRNCEEGEHHFWALNLQRRRWMHLPVLPTAQPGIEQTLGQLYLYNSKGSAEAGDASLVALWWTTDRQRVRYTLSPDGDEWALYSAKSAQMNKPPIL